MKHYVVSQQNLFTCLLTIVLVGLVISLSPLSILSPPGVHAQNNNVTSDNISSSDNNTSDNNTSSDNLTTELPSDNTTPEITPPIETSFPVAPTLNKVTALISPDRNTEIKSPNGKVILRIPEGAVSVPVEVELAEHDPIGSTGTRMINLFELNAWSVDSSEVEEVTPEMPSSSDNTTSEVTSGSDNATQEIPSQSDNISLDTTLQSDNTTSEIITPSSNTTQETPLPSYNISPKTPRQEITEFNKELQIIIQHTPEELRGLDLDSLHLYCLDEETRQWVPVPSRLDRDTITLTATLTHFSTYGEQANPLQNGPGRVMASDVNLHSGAATFSYPFELPPGPGGFQPKLELTYNSGSVDEMKNKRDAGSWVGIGWTLHLGRISYDLTSNEYFLDLNSASYKILSSDGVNYHTQPEQHYQIIRSDNITWEMRDREGNLYQFGGTDNSTQYVYETTTQYYRWDLSLIQDTNGNNATVSYVQDVSDNTVHSAYPDYLKYGTDNVSMVQFNFSAGRNDNPQGTETNPAPKVVENRKLDSIEVSFNGSLVRKYTFAYTTTDCTLDDTYYDGGIYYSGKHILDSITQIGSDNTSSLPTMEFAYEDKQVYRKTNDDPYGGNPGNPASIYWPFLVAISSGYGGGVSFSYTQIPDTTVFDTWTRQAVTTKTVNNGIAPNETYTYTYTGNPQYKGTSWDQEFRGWNEVRETDAAGNYVKHWFYTTGTIGGKVAEKLTGQEYKTEWYSSNSTLLKTKIHDLSWEPTESLSEVGWLSGWKERVQFIIDHTKIDSTLTHFPILIHLSSECGQDSANLTKVFDEVEDNSQEIAITTANNTQLYVEVEEWDAAANEAWLWVSSENWTISNSEDTTLYLYYGNSANNTAYVGDPGSDAAQNVWDSNFVLVDHMQDDPDSSSTKDSTSNDNNGTKKGSNEPLETMGVVGDAQVFDGTNDYIDIPDNFQTNTGIVELLFKVSGWDDSTRNLFSISRNADNVATFFYIDVQHTAGGNRLYANFYINGDTIWQAYIPNATFDPSTDNDWHHFAVVQNGTAPVLYLDGIDANAEFSQATQEQNKGKWFDDLYSASYPPDTCRIGSTRRNGADSLFFYGLIDDIHVHSANASTAWIKASYYTTNDELLTFYENWVVHLDQVDETSYNEASGNQTSRTRYEHDDYGNVITEYLDGDITDDTDNATIHRLYAENTTANILSLPARERVYEGTVTSDNGTGLVKETVYYYDSSDNWTAPPEKGNLTRQQVSANATASVSSNFTYDAWGNILSSTDPEGNSTTWTYETTYHTYPLTKTLPNGLLESYTYDPGTNNLLSITDVNDQVTTYEYDTFKRLMKVIKPGDSSGNPSTEYQYNNWSILNQQHIKTITKVSDNESLWQSQYFDGLGRIVQTHAQGETDNVTIISSTITYNNRGMTAREYVSQSLYSSEVNGYKGGSWLEDWENRVEITMDSSKINSNLAHFPVLIHLSDSSGLNNASVTGVFDEIGDNYQKIAVIDAYSQTQLYVEVEKWDAANEEAWLWVSKSGWTISNSENTTLYLYYDSDQPDNTTYVGDPGSNAAQAVWDSNYILVSHMNDNPDVNHTLDSTSNENNGTKSSSSIEQTDSDCSCELSSVYPRVGQRFNSFPANTITKASFKLYRVGSITGTLYVRVRKVSDDSIIGTLGSLDVSTLPDGATNAAWYDFKSSSVEIPSSQDVRVMCEYDGGNESWGARVRAIESDVSSGMLTRKFPDSNYYDSESVDAAFKLYWSNGPVETTGKVGDAQDFDGEDDQVDFVNISEDLCTVELCVKPVAQVTTTSNPENIVGLSSSGYGAAFGNVTGLLTDETLTILGTSGGFNHRTGVANYTFDTQFYHIVFVWNSDQNRYDFYINGQLQTMISGGDGHVPLITGDTFIIGRREPASQTWGDITCDEVRISNIACSPAWIKASHYTVNDELLSFSEPEEYEEYNTSSGQYTSYTYDGLGRVITQTNADNTTITHDYSTAWQDVVTNERGFNKRYSYDAFNRLVEVIEYDSSNETYATTNYIYDVLGNLTQVMDANSNNTTMTYDWLSRKTAMSDPDMGSWSYAYDDNGNLIGQTDAKGQTIEMVYDNLNRLTDKVYSSANMTDISYTYDQGNNGKGRRTSMSDASGNTTYAYDARGRLIEERRTIGSDNFTTQFYYDSADRLVSTIYPTGENVTQGYDGRGLPYSLNGTLAGNLVTSTSYNALGLPTQIDLGNGLSNSFEYWGIDEPGGYYGRLYRIGVGDIMDVRHTWDAGGNLESRYDAVVDETESFTYDFLDRLTAASLSGVYSKTYTYNEIGNIMSMNSDNYTYDSTQPHAVDSIGDTNYYYDANGNMTDRGGQTLAWDAENRPTSVSENGTTAYFFYDGDGNRIRKTENGETVLYINKYYEVNLTTGNATSYYYYGDRLVAMSENGTLSYIHQDHLTGTSLMTSENGTLISSIDYMPYGETRVGDVPTDKKFTGQRLDDTGLYYYGARYYDPTMGRFISADTIVPNPANPQSFNRYSYCLNNPLKYIDPSGHDVYIGDVNVQHIEFLMKESYYLYDTDTYKHYAEVINSNLYQAWEIIEEFAPEMAQELLDSDLDIEVTWADLPENVSGQSPPERIEINSKYRNKNAIDIVKTFGHESFHQLMDIFGFSHNSIFEEACAFSYGRALDNIVTPISSWFGDIFSRKDDLKSSMSVSEVDRYVHNSTWKSYYDNCPTYTDNIIDFSNPMFRPLLSEGGLSYMFELYAYYFPHK